MPRIVRIIGVFFLCGALAGLCSALSMSRSGDQPIAPLVGVIFLIALASSLGLVRARGWLALDPSTLSYVAAALVVVVSYPIGILAVLVGMSLSPFRSEPLTAWVGLSLGALAEAILVAFALRLATRKWDASVMSLFVLAGLGMAIMGTIAPVLWPDNHHKVFAFATLPVGMGLFAGLCGLWLTRAQPLDQQPKH